ncbi:universal stress protein [Natrialbaceae archaeon A-CW1-1]
MPRHVLVPIDGSDHAAAGLEYSLQSFPDATITALYVVDPSRDHTTGVGSETDPETRAKSRGERVLENATDRGDDHGRTVRTELRTGTPHTEILETASESDVDHIVMGSHGRSPITGPFLGHVSETVVQRAPVSTTVVPEGTTALENRDLPGNVLVPVDGSEQAEAALRYALETFPGATHTAFYALEVPFDRSREEVEGTYLEAILDEHERQGEEILQSAVAVADEYDAELGTASASGKPSREIIAHAETGDYDQIVMGSHGRSLAARLFTGSVAERVAQRSPLTVTLVRGGRNV